MVRMYSYISSISNRFWKKARKLHFHNWRHYKYDMFYRQSRICIKCGIMKLNYKNK